MPLIVAKDRSSTDGPAYSLSQGQDLAVRKGILITSRNDNAIVGESGGQSVTVAGVVTGALAGITLGDDRLGDAGCEVRILKDGFVTGNSGVSIFGTRFTIRNDGQISGSESGIVFNADGPGVSRIVNNGLISAGFIGIYRGGFDAEGQKVVLVNNGKIVASTSYFASFPDAVDVIINRGVMRGAIATSAGDDVIDNRGGRIIGGVFAGSGDDWFKPGTQAEHWDGESNTDTVDYRSAGAVKVALDGSLNGTGAARNDTFNLVENLQGSQRGADLLVGSADVNRITGNGGADTIRGLDGDDTLTGGKGRDVLTGGAGDDHFTFRAPGEGGDRITAFGNDMGDSDVIRIVRAGFGAGLQPGVLDESRYHEGATNQANDANCRFILRTGDDTLWFDRDGRGGAAPVLIADLPNVGFGAEDILIV